MNEPKTIKIPTTIEPVWTCVEAARFLRLHPKTVKRIDEALAVRDLALKNPGKSPL